MDQKLSQVERELKCAAITFAVYGRLKCKDIDTESKRIYPSAGYNFSRRPGTPPTIPTPAPVATPCISSLKISQNANITS